MNDGIRIIHGLLVGGLEHFLFSIIYWRILPIDELHHFSRWLVNHQPVVYITIFHKPNWEFNH